jgi:hypothetical protein
MLKASQSECNLVPRALDKIENQLKMTGIRAPNNLNFYFKQIKNQMVPMRQLDSE